MKGRRRKWHRESRTGKRRSRRRRKLREERRKRRLKQYYLLRIANIASSGPDKKQNVDSQNG